MKYRFLLTACAAFTVLFATAQKQSLKVFAITSAEKGTFQWNGVKLVDINSGEVLQTVFDSKQSSFTAYNARTGNAVSTTVKQGAVNEVQSPFHSMSAAAAFDKRHNRLYFTPMYVNELRYIDLDAKTPRIYYFQDEPFSKGVDLKNEANHITRMVVAADGNGYALSNDGNHLVKFTTSRKPVITDLGALQDDPANAEISIHDKRTSWGGDMIADAFGNLYVISAFHHVFKVDIGNKVATYVGAIKGIPAGFTTNGAVVDEGDDGKLIVGSANSIEGFYRVNMDDWQATRITGAGQVFNASDLANSKLAFESRRQPVAELFTRDVVRNGQIAVYPNPVSTGRFRVSFNSKDPGRYDIQLVDLTGRVMTHKIVQITYAGQVAEMTVNAGLARGAYLVKVLNNGKKTVCTDKIVVE